MPPHRPISPVEATILFYLRDEAADDCGWRRRGVRGWRMYGEVKAATGLYIFERLPFLAVRGLLDRIDVPEYGRRRPTSLYRISEAGTRAVAELERRPYRPLPVPEARDESGGNLFAPARAWGSLDTLRRHAVEEIGPVRLGAYGWLTAAEIHRENDLRGEGLPWLLRRGLVERREVPPPPGRRTPVAYYHASPAGLRTDYVDAVAAPSGRVEVVEARVREEAGPGSRRGGTRGGRPGPRPAGRNASPRHDGDTRLGPGPSAVHVRGAGPATEPGA